MGDISNSVLVVLVIAAIAISVGGTVITLNAVQPGLLVISGGATTGNLTFQIEQEVTLNVTQDIINFGAGRVLDNCTSCIISTAHGSNNASCGNWTYAGSVNNFTIENLGNVQANVNISANNASDWIGGGTGTIPDPSVQFLSYNVETDACGTTYGWTELYDYQQPVCDDFNHTAGEDEFGVAMQITIPEDATIGQKDTTVTFTIGAA